MSFFDIEFFVLNSQGKIKNFLEQFFLRRVKNPVFIFSGSGFSGKSYFAFAILKSLYCEKNIDIKFYFCNECINCSYLNRFLLNDSIYINTRYSLNSIFFLFDLFNQQKNLFYLTCLLKELNHLYYSLLLEFNFEASSGIKKKTEELDLKNIYDYRIKIFEIEKDLKNISLKKVTMELDNQISFLKDSLEAIQLCFNKKISIHLVRKIQDFFYQTKIEKNQRLLIIDDIQDISSESGNVFLKFLEEPPKDLWIILITNRFDAILKTIQSRAIHLAFSPFSTERKFKLFQTFFPSLILSKKDINFNLPLLQIFEKLCFYENKWIKHLRFFLYNLINKDSKLWIFSFVKKLIIDDSSKNRDEENSIFYFLNLWIIFLQELEIVISQKKAIFLPSHYHFKKFNLLLELNLEDHILNKYFKLKKLEISRIKEAIYIFSNNVKVFSLSWEAVLIGFIFQIESLIAKSIED